MRRGRQGQAEEWVAQAGARWLKLVAKEAAQKLALELVRDAALGKPLRKAATGQEEKKHGRQALLQPQLAGGRWPLHLLL